MAPAAHTRGRARAVRQLRARPASPRLAWAPALALVVLALVAPAAARGRALQALQLPDGFAVPNVFQTPRRLLPTVIPGQFVVTMREDVPNLHDLLERVLPPLRNATGGLEEVVRFDGLLKGFTFRARRPAGLPGLLSALLALPSIKHIEPDQLFYPELATVNSIGGKWEVPTGVLRMQAALYNDAADELAWVQPNVTSDSVVVAVLDTGIDAGHPDLVGNVMGGLSFVGEDPLEDLNGHGTHVAGTISANNNGFGTSGVHPGTKVFALQVFNKLGTGSTSSIVSAINWLATNGRANKIRVANMSLGGPSSVAVCNAVYYAVKAGITFVVAAGNQGRSMLTTSPANCPTALAVTSVSDYDGLPGGLGTPAGEEDLDDTATDFSNWGSAETANRTVAGPGRLILSTWSRKACGTYGMECVSWGPWAFLSGTSMASPHVASVVARCYRAGVCGAEEGSEMDRIMRLTAEYNLANPGYGFEGDPSRPVEGGKVFGWMEPEPELELRDPLAYDVKLSAPAGYDPLVDFASPAGRVPRRYLVRMREGVPDLASAISGLLVNTTAPSSFAAGAGLDGLAPPASLADAGASAAQSFSGGGVQGFVLDLPANVDEAAAVAELAAHSSVLRVVPDTWVGIAAATVRLPPGAEATTSLLRIGAIVSPRRAASSARPMAQAPANGSVAVALIDTGCDVTNADLNVVGGVDFTSDNSFGLDGNGHGTHVAGILGSRGDGSGIVGMFPDVPLYCLKVLGASGQGTMGTVVTALTWVAENGRARRIRVVNLSLSGETNEEVCDAISAVTRQGITVVVAAGNNGQDVSRFSPGNCGDALVVTAMADFDGAPGGLRGLDAGTGETDDAAARFSNYAARGRPANMIAAPGVRVLSYQPAYKCADGSAACIAGTPNLGYLSGTSMAAPIVAGQAAMCYEKGACSSNRGSEWAKLTRAAAAYARGHADHGFAGDARDPATAAERAAMVELKDDRFDASSCPCSKLWCHISQKGLQGGAVVGALAVVPAIAARDVLLKNVTLDPLRLLQGAAYSAAAGLGLTFVLGSLRLTQMDRAGMEDRAGSVLGLAAAAWLLRGNGGAKPVHYAGGASLGAAAGILAHVLTRPAEQRGANRMVDELRT
ncbi:aprE [Scenedesmus sp. PABB004]|nr:aprE [Scenedesmus sp. PABB004]